jgi:predicted ATP-binding protein involved in virulence
MQIQQISVTGLFGIFDHVIPLNMADRITIIHGPNGFGKTAILRLLDGLFNYRYSVFRTVPFSKFKIDLDNGSYVEIVKTINESEKKEEITLNFCDRYLKIDSFSLKRIYSDRDIGSDLRFLDNIPGLYQVNSKSWRYVPTNEILSLEEVIYRFEDKMPPDLSFSEEPEWLWLFEDKMPANLRFSKEPEWFKDLKSNIHLRLIESQRLLNVVDRIPARRSAYSELDSEAFSMLPTVSAYSNELAQILRDKFTEYGVISQSLDRTFPTRLVQRQPSSTLTTEELRDRLDRLEVNRSRLIQLGLLNKNENSEFPIQSPVIDENTKNILSVYVEDVEKKLSTLDNIATKLELLSKIINSKFAYKEIDFSREKGFVFKTLYNSSSSDSHALSPTDLSSGEQHELVLLYELLFKIEAKSLVLIDEPELSLHVGWQVNFLKDLQEVTKLADLDILMATHSPDIIQDRWDLTVELQGLKK